MCNQFPQSHNTGREQLPSSTSFPSQSIPRSRATHEPPPPLCLPFPLPSPPPPFPLSRGGRATKTRGVTCIMHTSSSNPQGATHRSAAVLDGGIRRGPPAVSLLAVSWAAESEWSYPLLCHCTSDPQCQLSDPWQGPTGWDSLLFPLWLDEAPLLYFHLRRSTAFKRLYIREKNNRFVRTHARGCTSFPQRCL